MNRRIGLLAAISASAAIAACGGDDGSQFAIDGGIDSGGGGRLDGSVGPTDGTAGNVDGAGSVVTSIAIVPPNAVLTVTNGVVPPPFQFKVVGTTANGTQVPLSNAMWTFDRYDLGTIDQFAGTLATTGFIGGVGNVAVSANGLKATGTATVVLKMISDPGNVDPGIKAKFPLATGADPQMALLYPYDKTVFPRGLPAPVVQWSGGAATDVYRLYISSNTASLEAYFTATQPAPSFALPTMPIDTWRKLTDSTTGNLTMALQRYDGTTAYVAKTLTWNVAAADLAGTIYYWEVNNGNVVKLQLGNAMGPQSFLQVPATASPAITCVACHSVSKNGKTIVTAFNGSASPWGTFDTTTGANLFVSGSDPNNGPAGSGFQAISPDGALVLYGQERALAYLSLNAFNSPTELAQLNPGAGNPVQPAWSGDGNHVAFAVRADGSWLDYTQSTLWTADVNPAATPPAFTNIKQIVAGTATRPTTTYPSYSPDSKWISFERSTQVRSRGAQAEMWLTSADGATLISLDAANTGTGLVTQTDANYEGTFMPVAVGGYFWLVFVSERVYGDTLTDTNEGSTSAPGRHKQLWVTAIDAAPTAGKDPSHPAFWLPGQNTADQNMRGEWALDPCKGLGQGCQAGYECCAGFCRSGDGGAPVCVVPPAGCAGVGDACKVTSDCCNATDTCIAGFCNQLTK